MKEKFSLQQIKAIVKKLRKAKSGVAEHAIMSPERDWGYVVTLNVLLLFGLVLFGVYTFINVEFGNDLSEGSRGVQASSVDEESLEFSLDYFEEQQATYSSLVNNPASVVDPFE